MKMPRAGYRAILFLFVGALAGAGLTILARSPSRPPPEARWQAAADGYATTRKLVATIQPFRVLSLERESEIAQTEILIELALLGWRHGLAAGDDWTKSIDTGASDTDLPTRCEKEYDKQIRKLTQLVLMSEEGYTKMKATEAALDNFIEDMEQVKK